MLHLIARTFILALLNLSTGGQTYDFIIHFDFICYFHDEYYWFEIQHFPTHPLCLSMSLYIFFSDEKKRQNFFNLKILFHLDNTDNLKHIHITHCILMTRSEDLQNDRHITMDF